MIAIVDFGMGNLGSILNMLKRIGIVATITSNSYDIARSEKIILPGVGAFGKGMKNLKDRDLVGVLRSKVYSENIPILGICLGMQLFSSWSEEGECEGLDWIEAKTVKFKFTGAQKLKIPHMGWNTISVEKPSLLLEGLGSDSRFYFVHSYHVVCDDEETVKATASYGVDFVAVVQKGNIYGTQFHPEKSHNHGMKILKNFASV